LRVVIDASRMIAELRAAGGDTTDVEVKSAAGGLPASLTATRSALANLPGGGTSGSGSAADAVHGGRARVTRAVGE
jgi:hypothetical protein